jgi:predicted transposase YdaD
MLGEPLVRYAQEILSMKPLVLPENPVLQQVITALEARGEARGKAEGKAEGEARGKADGLLLLLRARGVAVDDVARARVLDCRDLAVLDRWFLRAVHATSVAAVFADD